MTVPISRGDHVSITRTTTVFQHSLMRCDLVRPSHDSLSVPREGIFGQWLGEDVCMLICHADLFDLDVSSFHVVSEMMPLAVHMASPRADLEVRCNLYGTAVVFEDSAFDFRRLGENVNSLS